MPKINSLQVWRGFAAILVVLFHIDLYAEEKLNLAFVWNIFSTGYTGVDFFFVLSGFIIFFMHEKDIGQRHKFDAYLRKRLIRVYPIYWIVTSIKLLALFMLPQIAKSYETEIGVIINSYLLIPQENLPIIGPAWTLSYEMYFYLLFAIAILMGRVGTYILFVLWFFTILCYNVGRAFDWIPLPNSHFITFFLNERTFEFILGCLSAYIITRHEFKYQTLIGSVLLILGFMSFIASSLYIAKVGDNVFSYTILFGIPSLLIVTGSVQLEIKHQYHLPKLLIFFGDASYSIYLTHGMFINLFSLVYQRMDFILEFSSSLALIIMAVGSIVGGCLIYFFIEKPMLNFLRKRFLSAKPSKAST